MVVINEVLTLSMQENADAARLVHADVAARGREWRELAQVLSREYARR